MNYKNKYMKAMIFATGFALLFAASFTLYHRDKVERESLFSAERTRAVEGFRTSVAGIADRKDVQMNAALAKEYLAMSGAENEKCRDIYAVLERICENKANDEDASAFAELGRRLNLLSFTSDKIDDFYRIIYTCRLSSETTDAENASSVNTGETGDVPAAKQIAKRLLGNSIKYNFVSFDNTVCMAYNANRFMKIDTSTESVFYYVYDCTPGKAVLSEAETGDKAVSFAMKALSQQLTGAGNAKAELVSVDSGVCTFHLRFPSHCDIPVTVSVRSDTGSTVLLDAGGLLGVTR